MSLQTHMESLAEKRLQIKEQIARESVRPLPDFVLITNLKKQNLMLKQEMQRYQSALEKTAEATS